MKETVILLLLLLCNFSTGLNGSSEERQTLSILAMVPFPDPEKPAWARPNYGAAHSLLPAAQLAIDQINNRSDVLRDYNLELLEGDSGCNVVTTTYVTMVDLLYSSDKPVVGIVGPACSEAALSVARQTGLDVPVHVTTGSIPLLDNRTDYPNTFGIISSSTAHVDVIFELMKQNSWINVAVLYDVLRPYYIETYRVFREKLKDYCSETEANITFSGGITETFLPLQEISSKGTRVIVVMSSAVPARKLLCLAAHRNMTFPAYQFVFQDRKLDHFDTEVTVTQLSETYTCSREMMIKAINCSILLHFGLTSVANETETVSQLTVQQVHEEYEMRLQQRGEEINMSLKYDEFAYAFYDAVWAMALSINKTVPLMNETLKDMLKDERSSLFTNIREQFYNLEFQGATVSVKFDNETGHVSSIVDVDQVKSNDTHLIRKWDGTHFINITNASAMGEFIDDSFNSTTVLLHPAIAAVGLCVSTFAFLLTVVFQVINIAYCECKSIKASSPRLNHLIFSGCYMITAAVVIYTIQAAFLPNLTSDRIIGSVFCNAFAWCLNIGYTCILATILVKLWRLNYVFLNSFKKQFLTDEVLVVVVIVLLTLEIVLCIVWAAYTPLIEFGEESLSEEEGMPVVVVKLQCESKNTWFTGIVVGYKLVVTAVVFYFSVRNRHIRMKRFRNTRSVNALLYSLALLWGFGGSLWLILYIRETHLNLLYSVSCVLLTSTALLSLFFIFLPPFIHLIEERCRRRKFSKSTWQKLAMFGLDPFY